jgi:hypothetical protein
VRSSAQPPAATTAARNQKRQTAKLRALNRLLVPRVLATGSLVSVATAFRVGTNCVGLLVRRLPPLVRLGLEGSTERGGAGTAEGAFRDELIALARDSAEVSWREMRRGVDDLDALTRTDGQTGPTAPRRQHRAKP